MGIQIDENIAEFGKTPHILKYMGSKREIIDFVKNSIDELNVNSQWLCDLFAGTGIVAGTLKEKYNIHANDIQAYSSILVNTYFAKFNKSVDPLEISIIKERVDEFVLQFLSKYGSLQFDYDPVHTLDEFITLENAQKKLIDAEFSVGFHLFTKFYSGTYWSYRQCVYIDSIRAVAEEYIGQPLYFAIMSSLIFAMSYTSQSTGHFAQYRDANSETSMQDILIYRRREIWPYFERKFKELTTLINGNGKQHRITTLDYNDCLRLIEKGSIVYADPPYQSVHYSRFYHVLETLVKYDYPNLHYKGRYRTDRHQSPFCKKTTVVEAFVKLFEGVKFQKSHMVLSYSDTGMITLEDLRSLACKTLGKEYSTNVLNIDHKHSKLGRNDEKESDVIEYALLFKRI